MENRAALRRKVLRGSLAAPVVLTVSSASVAAASFARCVANTNTSPDSFFVNSSDRWFRTQVEVMELSSHGLSLGHFYEDPVKDVFVSITPPHRALTFNRSTMPLDNSVKVTSQSTRWAVVWFDRNTSARYSRITLQQPFGSSAISVSCFASFSKI
jgi:hypothetical protein